MRRQLLLLILVPLLASCERTFALFPLEVDTGSAVVRIELRERRGRAPDDEGTIEPGGELLLELERPVRLDGEAGELVAGFGAVPEGVEMTVLDEDGVAVARGPAASSFAGVERGVAVDAPLRVPRGSTVATIRFSAPSRGESVRLERLRLRPSTSGAGRTHPQDVSLNPESRRLYASPGTAVESWSVEGWTFDASGDERWDPRAPVEIRYRYEHDASVDAEAGPARATVEVGARRFELDLRPGANRVVLYPRVEGVRVERLHVEPAPTLERDASRFSIEWIGPAEAPGDLPAAVPADMGTLMRYPVELWRQPDYELFSWTLYPNVLVVDSASYEVQARFFKRLAFFVEKVGYRGELLTDDQLRGRHGYNAHNYNAEGLADFFTAVEDRLLDLTAEERLLREVVVANGIIRSVDGGYEPVGGGVLAVAQESYAVPTLRQLLVAHEAYHGVYYAEPEYVDAVDELWAGLDEREQRYWRLLLSGLRYDVDDPYLVRNEYHAYLLQQPVAAAGWYFESRSAERLRRWYPALGSWFDAYFADYAGTHREQAARVQAELYRLTGLVARDVSCLEPIDGLEPIDAK